MSSEQFTAELVEGHAATEAGVVSDLTYAAQTPEPLTAGERFTIVVPAGARVEQIDTEHMLPAPHRKKGTAQLLDATSFAAYVQKHHEHDRTELYADPGKPGVVAVLNGAGVREDGQEVTGWGDHRAVLVFRETDAWKRWTTRNGVMGGQVDFAEHIESSLPDIAEPPGADMLEMAQSFQAHSRVQFESGRDLSSGQRQLVYREETSATAGTKGDITIPREFVLGIAPYEGSGLYKITARLRYRITEGRLQIGYVLDRPEDIKRAAFDDCLKQVQDETARVALLGTPPA